MSVAASPPGPAKPVHLSRNFVRLWASTATSNLGDGVTLAALPLIASSLTERPMGVATVSAAAGLPWLLFSLISGVLADRFDRRRLMVLVDTCRAILLLTVALLTTTGKLTLSLLLVLAFFLGTAETVFANTHQAIVPSVVMDDALETANGRLFAAEVLMNRFAGPPLGGFLFSVTAVAPFIFDAATFLISAAILITMQGKFNPALSANRPNQPVRVEIQEGLRWLWGHSFLRSLGLLIATINLLYSAGLAIFVVFAKVVLGVGGFGFGILLSAGAVGAFMGSLLAARIRKAVGYRPLFFAALLFTALADLVIAFTSDVVLVGVMMTLSAFGGMVLNVVNLSLRQRLVPDGLRGRVNSILRLFSWGAIPLGALLGGGLAEAAGVRAPFLAGAVGFGLLSILVIPMLRSASIDS